MNDTHKTIDDAELLIDVITHSGFDIRHTEVKEAKNSILHPFDDINLSDRSKEFWRGRGYNNMWKHQKMAISLAKKGNNVCVSTSTSSGKTEIFQTVAIETLEKRRGAKVLAVYSAKALNRQQRERWEKTGFKIGKIDGDDKNRSNRLETLNKSDIVVMTPDVVHAFLMANVRNREIGSEIRTFIKNIDLIIIDEIHLYRGIFGSNCAYLFRRLNNLRRLYRGDLSFPQYITASATLPNPGEHSSLITGCSNFENIGLENDGSPTAETTFFYIEKKNDEENSMAQAIAHLVSSLTNIDGAKSITFTNGRQQAGHYTMRGLEIIEQFDNLKKNKIYAFRAGGEKQAREKILDAMEAKEFNGIISTSALEIGIDVSGLNICILANIPYDLNSYYQRIGRVGRGAGQNKSYVIIVNDESIAARILFNNGFDISKVLPDLEPALHLDNERILYLQAAMHVDTYNSNAELEGKMIDQNLHNYFPTSFCNLTTKLQTRQEPEGYKNMVESLSNPHFISLRNMGANYQIVEGDESVDEVTRKQLYNEAYKGAIRNASRINNENEIEYYNQRVLKIEKNTRIITVKKETRKNKTKPNRRIFLNPGLTKNSMNSALSFGDTLILNTSIREIQTIYGYHEEFFNNREYHPYDRPYRDSQYTTGMIIFDPHLNERGVDISQIAEILYNVLLMQKQFERSDIEYGSSTLSYSSPFRDLNLNAGDKFITIYDSNKLNITNELLETNLLKKTFAFLEANINHYSETLFATPINETTKNAALKLCRNIIEKEGVQLFIEELPSTIKVFAVNSQANVEFVNNETGESEIIKCIIGGINKVADSIDEVDYNVFMMANGNFISQVVNMDLVKPCDESIFSEYDWRNGVIVNS